MTVKKAAAMDFCPSPIDLAAAVSGRLPELASEPIFQHLTECAACVETLPQLMIPDVIERALRHDESYGALTPLDPVFVQEVISRVKRTTDSELSSTETHIGVESGTNEGSADGTSFEFLAPAESPEEIGRLGGYAILRVLDQGGMGIVFLAMDLQLKRPIALKVMKPKLASDPAARRRYLREAQVAAALRHDNIVTIFQVGEQAGVPFLAMELLEGESLDARLRRESQLPIDEAMHIGREIADGLSAAHAKGLIHRDIKPANIWLQRISVSNDQSLDSKTDVSRSHFGIPNQSLDFPRVKILDFGLARSRSDTENLTQSGMILGTPAFMAPEQARGDDIDERADLFSLGCVLYRILTGKSAFGGRDVMATLAALASREPVSPHLLRADVSPNLSNLVMRLLAKDRDARPSSALEVVRELAEISQTTGTTPLRVLSDDEKRSRETDRTALSVDAQVTHSPALPRKRIRQILFGISTIVLLAVVIVRIRTNDGTETEVAVNIRGEVKSVQTEIVNNGSATNSPKGEASTIQTEGGWHGWPSDAPKPAIAPFDAEQAQKHQDAWADYLKIPAEYTNSLGMKFRLIPPGEFLMGSTSAEVEVLEQSTDNAGWQEFFRCQKPRHLVRITQPYYSGVHEVTQQQYEDVMGSNPSQFAKTGATPAISAMVVGMDTTKHPVESVRWVDAAAFCDKLSEREGTRSPYEVRLVGDGIVNFRSGDGYHLPTEAEWEYATRAGTSTLFWKGDTYNDLLAVGWVEGNAEGRSHPVGILPANPFGLFDVHGNVWEWCQDWFLPTYYQSFAVQTAVDPAGPAEAPYLAYQDPTRWVLDLTKIVPRGPNTIALRSLRGGSLTRPFNCCWSACRWGNGSHLTSDHGFRVVLNVGAVKATLRRRSNEGAHANPTTNTLPANAPLAAIAPFNAEQAKMHQETWSTHLKVPVEYTNSIGMKFRLIPPGEFIMGSSPTEIEEALKELPPDNKQWLECIKSEAPQHKVILTQSIYLGVNEVTQAEYEKVMGQNPSHFAPMGMGKEAVAGMETTDHPVENVSWIDAAEFCAKLSQQEKLKPFYFRAGETITPLDGTGYRLPSEAEWEFACRAGTATKYWIGNKDEDLVRAGWFLANSGGRTHAVGELKANPFGLADIQGNVWEWVQDGWDATFYGQFHETPAINPNSPFTAGSHRVLRGGYWNNSASDCRSSHRVSGNPPGRHFSLGLRVSLPVSAVIAVTALPVEK